MSFDERYRAQTANLYYTHIVYYRLCITLIDMVRLMIKLNCDALLLRRFYILYNNLQNVLKMLSRF